MLRIGDPRTILVLAVLVIAAIAVKAELSPDPAMRSKKAPPGAKAGLLATGRARA